MGDNSSDILTNIYRYDGPQSPGLKPVYRLLPGECLEWGDLMHVMEIQKVELLVMMACRVKPPPISFRRLMANSSDHGALRSGGPSPTRSLQEKEKWCPPDTTNPVGKIPAFGETAKAPTPAPTPAETMLAPTLAPTLASPEGTCAAVGGDCSKSKCCADTSMTCYAKNEYWASCMSSCDSEKPDVFDRKTWGCAVLSKGQNHNLALCHSAGDGNLPDVEHLLKAKANVESDCGVKMTPLQLAAQNGHKAVAALLLKEGANVDDRDYDQWTPLHSAARNGHEAVAALLLKEGADANAENSDGDTPLRLTAYDWCGDTAECDAVADLLRKLGATGGHDGGSFLR